VSRHHYDIIILGDSLASRLAGVLLAKAGKRVMTFRPQQPTYASWLFNSLHLSQVLEQLGGRNSLTAARKLQVITEQSRLELHGRQTLGDELRREFPSSHQQVGNLLGHLQEIGARLETLILDGAGLPLFDLAGRIRFRRKLLFSRLNVRGLNRPLRGLLDQIDDAAPRTLLEALFSGLAMAPADSLRVAEGALLWSSASQPQGISKSALDDLLLRRYEQFHGSIEPFDTIERIAEDGTLYLKNGAICSADTLIVGSSDVILSLASSQRKLARIHPAPWRWQTSPILIGTSPVLASRVILAHPRPLRVTLAQSPTGTICTTEYRGIGNPEPPTEETLRSQLTTILPFASFSLTPATPEPSTTDGLRWPSCRAFPATSLRLRFTEQLLLGSADALPFLGSTGEVMTGVALAQHLLRKTK